MAEAGARLAIRLLQEAAERGDLDPWDVDVIAVVDGFLDQLRSRIEVPRLVAVASGGRGGSFEQDLADTSEAFLAASVLVGLKAEVLEMQTFPAPTVDDEVAELGLEDDGPDGLLNQAFALPRRPERHLLRRPVAPPPLQRPVTLGELIRQLEDIAERLEANEGNGRQRSRSRRFSDRAVIEQVAALAHREKLPETTAALSQFLLAWPAAQDWCCFEALVGAWAAVAPADLDCDRVGVFWALLFLCSQGRVELQQEGGLHGPLRLHRIEADAGSMPVTIAAPRVGSDPGPAGQAQAA
ncbi:MAG: segregation/condensation protein A [Vulcanococcus sp.]